ncbi:MAG TPA: T9SS type A sorting domain-containing protein, partial [Ignavibacteriaceae bacterium]|nr:T9SS type A sorting domain-containing protein [Ignavibacteriaceae bacterium]
DIDQESKSPDNYSLFQNYPNPFNGETTIKYNVSKEANVKIEIFNVLGERIKTLINEQQMPDYYSVRWDSKNDKGNTMNSGIYFVRFFSNNFSEIKKIILLR